MVKVHLLMKSFLVVLMYFCLSATGKSPQKGNIISLLAKCGSRDYHQQIAMGQMLSPRLRLLFQVTLANKFNYTEFDVCDDEKELIKVLDMMLLDPKWYIDNDEINIQAVIVFMPENMLKSLVSYLSYTDIKIFPMFSTSKAANPWFEKFPNFIPIFDLLAETIVIDLISKFNWKHAAIFDITGDTRNDQLFRNEIIHEGLPKHCIDYKTLHIKDLNRPHIINKTFEALLRNVDNKVVIVKGNKAAQFMVLAYKYGVAQKYWVLMTKFKGDSNSHYPEFMSITGKLPKHYSNEDIRYHNDTNCNPSYARMRKAINKCKGKFDANPSYRTKHFHYVYHSLVPKRMYEVLVTLTGKNLNYKNPNIWQYYNYKSSEKQGIKDIQKTKFMIQLGSGKCPVCKQCQSDCQINGYRKLKSSIFNYSYGIGCLQCKRHLTIDSFGTCSECPLPFIPNVNQTECYNPIITEDILPACHVVNTLGALTCIFILTIYVKNKDTPVVRSSDFKLTVIQLCLCIVMFIALPVSHLIEINWFVCSARPCVLGILLVFIVSIVVCKAEKILIIFYTKRRLTKKDIKDIYIRQTLIFCFLVMVDLIILPTAIQLPAEVLRKPHLSNTVDTYVMVYCSSDARFDVQIVYCITLLLLAIGQGYRGRKLPSNYNEGNSIIVGAASTICAFSFMIWAINTPQHEKERTSIIWLCLCVSMLFLIIALYGPKVYIILFQSHKNTKKHRGNRMLCDSKMKRSEKMFSVRRRDSITRLLPKSIRRKVEITKV